MKILLLLLPLVSLMMIPAFADTEPDWFKTHALWWQDDFISDSDVFNALENLFATNMNKLDKFINSTGSEHRASDKEHRASNATSQIQSSTLNSTESFGVSFDDTIEVADCDEFEDAPSFSQVETDRESARFTGDLQIPDLPCDPIPTVELPDLDDSVYPGLEEEDIVVEYTEAEDTEVEDTYDDLSDLPGLDYDEDAVIWTTSVHFINGEPYPIFQFMILARGSEDPTCPNGTFAPVSKSYNTVYHLNFDDVGLVYDESANNDCGNFGEWTSEASEEYYPITEAQGEFMREQFNFDFVFESYSP